MQHLEPLMRQNFLEYASYVIMDRAIPDIRDGCKPVQRRILHTLFGIDDGKFHKVANIIGETMKLHPHGDVSIGDALVVLANKEYFIEKQGNFGNIITGHQAAAARYIECRLTPLAKETLFNRELTEYQNSYDGRRKEPVFLPAKLPVALMLGTEGIAVGMATKILPHNLSELWRAQIAQLKGSKVKLLPDFPQGGTMDAAEYADGSGKVRVRATIEPVGDKKVVIRQIPFGTTTDQLIASVESAIQKNKVKISSINDFTADKVEIELTLARGTYAEEVIPQLYAYTDCEMSVASNIVVLKGRHPVQCKVNDVLVTLTTQLQEQLKHELEHALERLQHKRHWLVLEHVFIEKRVYKAIETANAQADLMQVVHRGMAPFKASFVAPLTDADVERLLDIRIRRISQHDVGKNRADLRACEEAIADKKRQLAHMTKTTVDYLQDLLKRYGKQYPRRTKLGTFTVIDRKKIARAHIKLSYDEATGFFGSDVKGGEPSLTVSEYDLVLAINEAGGLRVMSAQSKVLVGNLLHLSLLKEGEIPEFIAIYTDSKKIAWAKRFSVQRFIKNREYKLIGDAGGKIHHLIRPGEAKTVRIHYAPGARQRITEADFSLKELTTVATLTARGTKLAPKASTRIRLL